MVTKFIKILHQTRGNYLTELFWFCYSGSNHLKYTESISAFRFIRVLPATFNNSLSTSDRFMWQIFQNICRIMFSSCLITHAPFGWKTSIAQLPVSLMMTSCKALIFKIWYEIWFKWNSLLLEYFTECKQNMILIMASNRKQINILRLC